MTVRPLLKPYLRVRPKGACVSGTKLQSDANS